MTLRLPRLTLGDVQLKSAWDKLCTALEGAIGDIEDQVTAIANAQNAADAAARETARINSYTAPSEVLSSDDLGGATGASISVAGHVRVYPVQGSIDVPDVTITGADVAGGPFAYTTQYSVYYDDTTLAEETPTFAAVVTATNHADAQPGAAAGRHFVGVITTPASGGGGTTGTGGAPPGGGGGEAIP